MGAGGAISSPGRMKLRLLLRLSTKEKASAHRKATGSLGVGWKSQLKEHLKLMLEGVILQGREECFTKSPPSS